MGLSTQRDARTSPPVVSCNETHTSQARCPGQPQAQSRWDLPLQGTVTLRITVVVLLIAVAQRDPKRDDHWALCVNMEEAMSQQSVSATTKETSRKFPNSPEISFIPRNAKDVER